MSLSSLSSLSSLRSPGSLKRTLGNLCDGLMSRLGLTVEPPWSFHAASLSACSAAMTSGTIL